MACLYVFGSIGLELVAVDSSPKSCGVEIERGWSDAIRAWGWAGTFHYERVRGLWTGAGFIDIVESGAELSKDEGVHESIKT